MLGVLSSSLCLCEEELRLKDALKKKGGEVCEVKERRSDEEEMESGKICVG